MNTEYDADVIVIGGGPVGTTALALLGKYGLSAIGLEREQEVWPTARAVHFDGETFRTLQALGVADQFVDATIPMASMHIENEAREVLVYIPTGQFGSQAWHDDINFHQPDIERLLRRVVTDQENVELRSGVTVTDVVNDDAGVLVHAVQDDGTEVELRARWAIAADGARSSTRQTLGIVGDKFGEDAQWVVADGHLIDSPGYETDMIFLGHHTRPALWVRLPGTRVRMEFMLMPGDDPEEIVTPEAIERISHGILPVDKFTPDRLAIYNFRGRIAQRWQAGNIFLAGDAAHTAPPLFGQGLCAGMRDIANIAWKMDLVKRGVADARLLDTYESERKPHATFWVEQAANAAVFVQTTDEATAAKRDAFLRENPAASAPVSPSLGAGLHEGDRDDRAGKLSVQPLLENGTRTDDLVGLRFVIATSPELFNSLTPTLREAIDADGDIVVLLEPAQTAPILEGAHAGALVIRPDRYIFGAADTTADLERLVHQIPQLANAAEQIAH
ncbi:MAG: bifunctional 3-(3-hydroxy-phenyl)propionate/3-hydroxycinnamic acid hydroxylase [Gulosibacter sp.]|uniref:bifunctional 3-(3-hydroxy-phenyl)propionate/3-hydroxycinnamic acid hydroxylase n=1 Tax=Gulosibacter sp. TaxID=2817531 RepID=UPI003F93D748